MKKVIVLVVFLATKFSSAQEIFDTIAPVEVSTASGFFQPINTSTHSIIKITSEDLEQLRGIGIEDLLAQKAGIYIAGAQSNNNENVAIKWRGGSDKDLLILIDGIPVSDHSQPTAVLYDLRNLDLSQVASIEILKGGGSILYGSNTSTGVINIQLKKPQQKTTTSLTLEHASWNTYTQKLSLSGTQQKWQYLTSISNGQSEGFSSAEDLQNEGFDNDGYSKQNALVHLAYIFDDRNQLIFRSSYDRLAYDYDQGAFEDGNDKGISQQFVQYLHFENKHKKGEFSFHFQYANNDRKFGQLEDTYHTDYRYLSDNFYASFKETYHLSDRMTLLGGAQLERNSMESYGKDFATQEYEKQIDRSDANEWIFNPYINLTYQHKGFHLSSGLRLNTHDQYGLHGVYSFSSAYIIPSADRAHQWKVRAAIQSAYISPTLYQLYSIYGNLNLVPESTTTYEGGISYESLSHFKLETTYYYRHERQPIDFYIDPVNSAYYYINGSDHAYIQGIEVDGQLSLSPTTRAEAHYTFTDRSEQVDRLPRHKIDASLHYQAFKETLISMAYSYVSDRSDAYYDAVNFQTMAVENAAYHLINLYANHTLIPHRLIVYGQLNNLFNASIEDLAGFTSKGRNYLLGVNITLTKK